MSTSSLFAVITEAQKLLDLKEFKDKVKYSSFTFKNTPELVNILEKLEELLGSYKELIQELGDLNKEEQLDINYIRKLKNFIKKLKDFQEKMSSLSQDQIEALNLPSDHKQKFKAKFEKTRAPQNLDMFFHQYNNIITTLDLHRKIQLLEDEIISL